MLMTTQKWRGLMCSLACIVSVLFQSGCSYYARDGGGTLTYDEVQPLMPVYSPEEIDEAVAFAQRGRIVSNPAKEYYESVSFNARPNAAVYMIRGCFTLLLTSTFWGEGYLYCRPKDSENVSPVIIRSHILASYVIGMRVRSDVINPETGQVKSKAITSGLPVIPWLYFYDNRVQPEGSLSFVSVKPLYRAMASLKPLESARFERRYSHTFLMGAVSWGVKDHNRFFQIFWIPFKTGEVKYSKDAG